MSRIEMKFLQPIKVEALSGKIISEFSPSKYAQYAYEWLSSGHDGIIEIIIENANKDYRAIFPVFSNEQINDAMHSVFEYLKRGIAYLMYQKFLKEELRNEHGLNRIKNQLRAHKGDRIDNSEKGGVQTFEDIFSEQDWKKYISVFEKTTPALLNKKWEFIGKPRKHKGVICAWIKSLQFKGVVKPTFNRSQLATILNEELKNFNVGRDGKTFDNRSEAFEKEFKRQIESLIS